MDVMPLADVVLTGPQDFLLPTSQASLTSNNKMGTTQSKTASEPIIFYNQSVPTQVCGYANSACNAIVSNVHRS